MGKRDSVGEDNVSEVKEVKTKWFEGLILAFENKTQKCFSTY